MKVYSLTGFSNSGRALPVCCGQGPCTVGRSPVLHLTRLTIGDCKAARGCRHSSPKHMLCLYFVSALGFHSEQCTVEIPPELHQITSADCCASSCKHSSDQHKIMLFCQQHPGNMLRDILVLSAMAILAEGQVLGAPATMHVHALAATAHDSEACYWSRSQHLTAVMLDLYGNAA